MVAPLLCFLWVSTQGKNTLDGTNSLSNLNRFHPCAKALLDSPSFALRNHTIMLDCGDSDGMDNIKGEAELGYLTDAFLLSNHVFEAIQEEIADPRTVVRAVIRTGAASSFRHCEDSRRTELRPTSYKSADSIERATSSIEMYIALAGDTWHVGRTNGWACQWTNEWSCQFSSCKPWRHWDVEVHTSKGARGFILGLEDGLQRNMKLDSEEHELDSQEMAGWVEHFLCLLGSKRIGFLFKRWTRAGAQRAIRRGLSNSCACPRRTRHKLHRGASAESSWTQLLKLCLI